MFIYVNIHVSIYVNVCLISMYIYICMYVYYNNRVEELEAELAQARAVRAQEAIAGGEADSRCVQCNTYCNEHCHKH